MCHTIVTLRAHLLAKCVLFKVYFTIISLFTFYYFFFLFIIYFYRDYCLFIIIAGRHQFLEIGPIELHYIRCLFTKLTSSVTTNLSLLRYSTQKCKFKCFYAPTTSLFKDSKTIGERH